MRIGIYSGTFDPMHEGHVLFAQVASEQFGLDEVLIIPEETPRYKPKVSSILHRIKMAEYALESAEAKMQVFPVQGLPSHTIHGVIERVYREYPEDEYYILMGSDVYKTIPTWGSRDDEDGSIKDIAEGVGFVVGINSMSELPDLKTITEEFKLNTRFVEVPIVGLSSRRIREQVAANEPPKGLNDSVAGFIQSEGIYK